MAPSPETRIAVANASRIGPGPVLVVGFGPELAEELPEAVVFHQNMRAHRAAPDSSFGAWLADGSFATAVVELPKAAGRLRMVLSMVRGSLPKGAKVFVAGHNDSGIRPAAGVLSEVIGDAQTVDTRSHCRLIRATVEEPRTSSLADWRVEFEDTVAGRRLRIVSYPGVFAHGRVDDATRMLLESITVKAGARALDVGSGCGVIGAWLRGAGVSVDCVDVDAVAVAATEETLASAEGPPARAFASDLYSEVSERYNYIVSNVPFHAGTQRTLGIAVPLIREARARLARNGEFWAVANRQLDLRGSFADTFARSDVIREDGRFRVWRAR